MISGHGDDAFRFGRPMVANFSSNVYGHVDLEPLKEHLRQRIDAIGHYPEPEPYTLEKALAGRLGINPSAVCATNGATEAIYLTAHTFANHPATILCPTFSEYADACRLYGSGRSAGRIHGNEARVGLVEQPVFLFSECPQEKRVPVAPWGKPHSQESGQAERAIRCPVKPGMTVWLCNPNNPTGGVIPKGDLVKAIEENPETLFVIDQSYGFFTKEELLTAAEAVRYPNVIQLHSMTKRYALPGLRLGYITANPALLEKIRAARMPWSVNALAIEAGLFLCEHPETGPIDLEALLAETQRLRDALNGIPGLMATPTKTHFFLCHLDQGRAADLKTWLAESHGILIRDASNFEGLDEGHFRIATQTPEENDLLVEAIRHYLEEFR